MGQLGNKAAPLRRRLKEPLAESWSNGKSKVERECYAIYSEHKASQTLNKSQIIARKGDNSNWFLAKTVADLLAATVTPKWVMQH